MKDYECTQCRKHFVADGRKRSFCSLPCCWKWRSEHRSTGQFTPGQKPWNSDMAGMGICKPNKGSFKPGRKSDCKADIGAVRTRTDKQGHKRIWVKVNDNGSSYDWELRAMVLWTAANGELPLGWVVHHKNRDTLDDSMANLEAMSRAGHLKIHRPEFEERRRNAANKATSRRHQQNRLAKAAGASA